VCWCMNPTSHFALQQFQCLWLTGKN
jgi:hypothetical protein